MAFKASRPTKSAGTKDTASTTDQPLSVDDLVGSPREEAGQVKDMKSSSGQLAGSGSQDRRFPRQYSGHSDRPAFAGEPSGFGSRRSGGSFRPDFGHRGGSPPSGRQGYRPDFTKVSSFVPASAGTSPDRSSGRRDAGPFRQSSPGPWRHDTGNGEGYRNNGTGFTQDINVPTETVRGVLDTMPEGHGFLRPKYAPGESDIYISQSQIRRFLLRNGDMVEGQARPPKENERYWGLLKVEKINDHPAESMERRPKFEDLVPVYPNKLLRLETGQHPLSTRIIDLVAPIGFGQRGLVVSPPKAGKTTILKELAAGIAANYPDVHLMAALIGERPEEVTDISRSVKGEVFASNFDESPGDQTRIAEVALDRARRLVEMGRDVVILLDSITRLARAYNLVVNPSGRTLSGGFDPAALYPAKRFLGAARCVEPQAQSSKLKAQSEESVDSGKAQNETIGGSLTVIGTALVDTGSRMDDLIYEEFKGTGNMELHLSRTLQERRVFPAIDVVRSGTRHDELLLGEEMMKNVATLRHMLSLLGDEERTMMLIERMGKTETNLQFLDSLAKGG